mmetsp:Transcript_103464/g.331744  ORF Transcript_103464/g.331744 Transcript_103464/m.331744 type:complete len:232 (-) Transcript_103464:1246-1941(-)
MPLSNGSKPSAGNLEAMLSLNLSKAARNSSSWVSRVRLARAKNSVKLNNSDPTFPNRRLGESNPSPPCILLMTRLATASARGPKAHVRASTSEVTGSPAGGVGPPWAAAACRRRCCRGPWPAAPAGLGGFGESRRKMRRNLPTSSARKPWQRWQAATSPKSASKSKKRGSRRRASPTVISARRARSGTKPTATKKSSSLPAGMLSAPSPATSAHVARRRSYSFRANLSRKL